MAFKQIKTGYKKVGKLQRKRGSYIEARKSTLYKKGSIYYAYALGNYWRMPTGKVLKQTFKIMLTKKRKR